MVHLPALISDLALILMTGAITTLIFKRIRQPLVLGYIIAGFLVGPHFKLLPTVADAENIEILAEIGVIFLLFSLGLEFSFKKLVRVGGAASITAFVEIVFITVTGFLLGRLLGWPLMDCLFLGGMLASSSTTIIIRAFDELGVKTKQFARIVFGVLVVEDIVVILLMVLLSTVAVTREFEGTQILMTILELLFFLALWFISGIYILPTFLRKARALLDEETLLILTIGLCLGMVVLATKVGFSAELGAFIMGSIIAETTSAERVEHLIKPIKDMFGAVFFVSIGMMIDPKAMVEYGFPIMCVTLLTLFGKLFSTTLGALLSGQPLKQSVQVGMSMAQIGEFAFIVATLGLSLGVISDFLFPVAVGASAITTFTTPYLIKFSEPLYNGLSRMLPEKMVNRLNRYTTSTQHIQAESEWKKVRRSYLLTIVTNSVLISATLFLSLYIIVPWLHKNLNNLLLSNIAGLLLFLGISAAFLWGLMAKKIDNMAYRELWMNKGYSKGPLLLLEWLRILIGLGFISFFVFTTFEATPAIIIVLLIIFVIFFLFSQRIQRFYQALEGRFLGNLNAREEAAYNTIDAKLSRKNASIQSDLTPYDAHITEMTVPGKADYVGRKLSELQWRENYGINIVYIKRGESVIHLPNRDSFLLPLDRAGVIGTDEQLRNFKPVFDTEEVADLKPVTTGDILLKKIKVDEFTRLKGLTIRDSGIREKTSGLVIGIERNDEWILNPESTTLFEWEDIIWIVGDRKKLQNFIKMQADEKNPGTN